MKVAFFFLFLLNGIQVMSQSHVPEGEYIFSRQEMVAGFKFSASEKFDFFFSYGGADRTASGTFTVKGKTITLISNKEAGNDFTVKSQSKEGTGYTLQFEDENTFLLNEIRCTFFINDERHEEYTDEKGMLKVTYPHCDSILIMHPLFPDIDTRIKDNKNDNNNFIVTLNPSLAGVSFKGIDFTITNDSTITCRQNYFMPLDDIVFEKQKKN